MLRRFVRVIGPWVAASVLGVATHRAPAAMVAEWQFNGTSSLAAGSTVPLDFTQWGVNASSVLGSAAAVTYNAGSTGISNTTYQPYLGSGYLDAPGGSDPGGGPYGQYGLRTSTSAGGGRYAGYMGFAGFGTGTYTSGPDSGKNKGGTCYLILKPNSDFNGTTLRGLMGTGYNIDSASSTGAIKLVVQNNVMRLQVGVGEAPYHSGIYSGGVTTDWNGDADTGDYVYAESTISSLTLDPTKWYFVAASWREGGTPVLYVRELSSTATALTGTTTTAGGNVLATIPTGIEPNVDPLVIGAYLADPGQVRTLAGASAKFAYARFDNVYSSTTDIDAVYASMSPWTTYDQYTALKGWYTTYASGKWYGKFKKNVGATPPQPNARQLDIAGWTQSFNTNFTSLTQITNNSGTGPWYAPGHANFGSGSFPTPGDAYFNNVFSITSGLNIRAYRTAVGQAWHPGCIATNSLTGFQGYYQKYGYFEMTATMPDNTTGTSQRYLAWPAFWLVSKNRNLDANGAADSHSNYSELDALEWYSGDPVGFHSTAHVHYRTDSGTHNGGTVSAGNYYNYVTTGLFPSGITGSGPHRYGIKVGPYYTIAYVDGNEMGRMQTVFEDTQPQFMIVDNAISDQGSTYTDNGVLEYNMNVSNVCSYALPTEKIVDNSDASGVTITGTWTSSSPGDQYGANSLDDGAASKGSKSVKFTPNLPCDGKYEVYVWWSAAANRATNVPVTITYNDPTVYNDTANPTASVNLNQTTNGGKWNLIGTFDFKEGSQGSVLISNTGTAAGTYVSADAVRFVLKPDTLLPLPRPVGTP